MKRTTSAAPTPTSPPLANIRRVVLGLGMVVVISSVYLLAHLVRELQAFGPIKESSSESQVKSEVPLGTFEEETAVAEPSISSLPPAASDPQVQELLAQL